MDAGYESAVSDTIFCNDRSTPGISTTGWSDDTGLGYGQQLTAYGATARTRVWNGVASAPTFKCPQKNDAFTVNDTSKGNGALTYPVGLITADEIVSAGSGKYLTTNTSYYLYRPEYWYWSLSPFFMRTSGSAYIFGVNSSGNLGNANAGYSVGGAIAPVINLSADYTSTLIGEGTMENPYQS